MARQPAFAPSLPPSTRPPPPPSPRRRPRFRMSSAPPDHARRTFLLQTPPLALAASAMLAALPSSGEMHSELSELASKIPGAGMPDVYYPAFFSGEWLVSRELYAVETPTPADAPAHATLGAAALAAWRERIGRRQSFVVRFVSHRGKVIEDRLVNERAEAAAEHPHQSVSVSWDRDNPNVISVTRGAGIGGTGGAAVTREVKVTKRAFVDGPQGYGTFVASEYARVVDVEGEGSLVGFGKPPSLYARRRIVRYRVSSVTDKFEPDGMDRIVVDYLYPPSPPDAKVAVLLKYRDFLNRKREGLVY